MVLVLVLDASESTSMASADRGGGEDNDNDEVPDALATAGVLVVDSVAAVVAVVPPSPDSLVDAWLG